MKTPYGLKWFIALSIISVLNALGATILFAFLTKLIPMLSGLITPAIQLSTVLVASEAVIGLIAIYKRSYLFYGLLILTFIARIGFMMYQLMGTTTETVLQLCMGILLCVFELWYFTQLKAYFHQPKSSSTTPRIINADKKVNLAVAVYIVLFVALTIYSFVGALKTREYNKTSATKYVKALEGKSFRERNEYCLSLDTKEKDTCLLVAFSVTKNLDNITPEHCNLFSVESNIIVCYSKIHRCDLAPVGQKRTICEFSERAFEAKAANNN